MKKKYMKDEDKKVKVGHTLTPGDLQFLDNESVRLKSNRSVIVGLAVKLYRQKMQRRIKRMTKALA